MLTATDKTDEAVAAVVTDAAALPAPAIRPTIWGLSPESLHDRYWASRGVQVIRSGSRSAIDSKAELFLLLDPDRLVLFDLRMWIDLLNWTKPDLLLLRLHARTKLGYCEVLTADKDGTFMRFERRYKAKHVIESRVGLTCEREFAEAWQKAGSVHEGWKQLRLAIPATYREIRSSPARIYTVGDPREMGRFVEELTAIWSFPGSTIARASKAPCKAWIDKVAKIDRNVRVIGPVWVGAGRSLTETDVVVGPAVLWDDPQARPAPDALDFAEIEPTGVGPRLNPQIGISSRYRIFKRLFDIVFSIIALVLTLPLYPFIAAAIWMEDGWPFFFSHERETLDGRVFRCLKFRSMRKNAPQMVDALAKQNQADGPQFFMDNDPRITKVGAFIRKTHLDELPQFINVLLGDMSVVGPRPSPRSENQYSAEWRDTRLSVRPGITGLWQVRRTRLRGQDFQEWIKYDIQYVEKMSWTLDLKLIWQTVTVVFRRAVRS